MYVIAIFAVFKFLITSTHSFIERRFDSLKPLTVLDPNFLPVIMFICPKPELPLLLIRVSPYLSVSWLCSCYLTEIIGILNKEEVRFFLSIILYLMYILLLVDERVCQIYSNSIKMSKIS